MSQLVTVVLAAGKGTRMKSALPKVLHPVGGKPMVRHVLDAAREAGAEKQVVVVGFGAESVEKTIGPQAEFVVQAEQLGTGHAVMQAREQLQAIEGTVMVLCGDTPLLTGTLLSKLYQAHKNAGAAATVLTAIVPDPGGYGRVIRNGQGQVTKIVEHKDASQEERKVDEVNTGIYCFEKEPLLNALARLTCDNVQREYYLTDVIGILNSGGNKVRAVSADDHRETLGINSRIQLAEAEKILRRRKLEDLMNDGVTIMDPDSTFIDAEVKVGPDTVIYPFTWLEGGTSVGGDCEIGPNTRIQNTVIGNGAVIHFTYAHDCEIGNNVTLGPYVHLRPGTKLAAGVKVGNFVEVKNSQVGQNSKIPHLSYIGDTDMGSQVNIGSGTITVNYDGKRKYRTTIEDGAFIGCNANLVAPVTIGRGSYVAAGSTITKDVPADSLGVARARQSVIDGWAEKHRNK
ncbi:MAG TPA: bifunctional UDP-N-acetylglucosamine diphosphorylase/glucosamine-1-phosphate N-acetyltransferase GlmU [Methylomusa anaerophila]|uniref:Bifunctional protein GlmU n=1 Tax=Methylomusa anaerophila TaxID=1930071 RepID=A0A348AGV5_9FIRM|nr:bifunctional UDP-N-acetylglucosamine diphosphorylase/glucosamine-1-phosphate N-acetyltransferase GlmU [Methylomusa anaerophila]BBB90303.1 bifunctional protein GlmU [Methylomusa anaerophila]HML89351.1 bifunctional UDP-N-acetylglucosamine diphosphorylase/glucosamine-1-phosphate N-acetyltransferase GlmU [Methylomusa anaerophila]